MDYICLSCGTIGEPKRSVKSDPQLGCIVLFCSIIVGLLLFLFCIPLFLALSFVAIPVILLIFVFFIGVVIYFKAKGKSFEDARIAFVRSIRGNAAIISSCAVCGSETLIPADSPNGKKWIAERAIEKPASNDKA